MPTPFSKDYIAANGSLVYTEDGQFFQAISGDVWKVGRFDEDTQTYWCERYEGEL